MPIFWLKFSTWRIWKEVCIRYIVQQIDYQLVVLFVGSRQLYDVILYWFGGIRLIMSNIVVCYYAMVSNKYNDHILPFYIYLIYLPKLTCLYQERQSNNFWKNRFEF